jgi:acetamidase/formamidase
MGFDPDLDDAAREALRDMIRWLTRLKGWTAEEAYVFCSLAATCTSRSWSTATRASTPW